MITGKREVAMENDIFYTYVSEIKAYKLLTAEEEADLSRKIAAGNETARKNLINSNLRLVISIAKKFADSNIPIMDLVQEGNIGLITAASKYNYSFNTRFSTYAYSWIMQYMLRYMHTKASFIHLPNRKKEMLRCLNSARSYLYQKHGHEPSCEELALYLDMSVEQVRMGINISYSVISLDTTYGEHDEMTVSDNIPDLNAGPEEKSMLGVKKQEVRKLMKTLPEIEQKVVYHRYNFDNDRKTKTLREIGELLGVSAETVRQMEMRAIQRMKISAAATREREILLTA
ncbi:MAG TPA: RNA polymerase subunit sigma [Treponema sp.]|nr:RNA polymerase subunit sigma [Treponema sp.]